VKKGEKRPLYPAAAKAKTQEGANAFARFYIQTLDWGYATTSAAYMNHYYEASCGVCKSFADSFMRTSAAKHFYLGFRITVEPAEPAQIAPVTAPADFCSQVTMDHTAGSAVDVRGNAINGGGAEQRVRLKLCAKHRGQVWKATYLNRSN
jgi:hypothetical protein